MLKESANNQLEYQRLSQEEMEKRGILGRLVGVCADFFSPTRNGRKYPEKLWENVFSDPIMKERIENGVCYGELGHPADREETDMEKIALCLAEVPKKGKDGKLRAVFDILNTPNGRILKSLCDYGSTIGISSRGSGDLETDYDGNESVNPDTYNCEGFDAVLIPAVKEARLQYVTESLGKTRYRKTLRDKLTESVNKANASERKIMLESLHNMGIDLDSHEVKEDITESYNFEVRPFKMRVNYGDNDFDTNSAVIIIPNALQSHDFKGKPITMDATIYPEDERGKVLNFNNEKEAQDWIDKYGDDVHLEIMNRDEIHAIPNNQVLDDEDLDEALMEGKTSSAFPRNIPEELSDIDYDYFVVGTSSEIWDYVKYRKSFKAKVDYVAKELRGLLTDYRDDNPRMPRKAGFPSLQYNKPVNEKDCKRVAEFLVKEFGSDKWYWYYPSARVAEPKLNENFRSENKAKIQNVPVEDVELGSLIYVTNGMNDVCLGTLKSLTPTSDGQYEFTVDVTMSLDGQNMGTYSGYCDEYLEVVNGFEPSINTYNYLNSQQIIDDLKNEFGEAFNEQPIDKEVCDFIKSKVPDIEVLDNFTIYATSNILSRNSSADIFSRNGHSVVKFKNSIYDFTNQQYKNNDNYYSEFDRVPVIFTYNNYIDAWWFKVDGLSVCQIIEPNGINESLGSGDQGKLNTTLSNYVWNALNDYADRYMTDEEDFSYSELKKAFDIIEDKVCGKYADKVNESLAEDLNTYPIEYSYSKETDDSLDRFYGHINVKATSEEEAIQKADKYLHSVEFENKNDISNISNIHIGDTEYTNADFLDEDLNVNDEELSLIVKYLESELGHTWTDISDEKKIRQLLNKIHQYNASLFNTPAADDDGAIVEELQNTLNENEKLKKQIIELQEKLSVCYAKEANLTEANMRRNDTISKLSTQTKKTKALNEKYNSLEAQFNENLNTLSKDRLKIKILEDNSESLKKTNSKLKEDLRGKFKEVSSLNEKLTALENKVKAKDKKHANEIASINEQLENSNKDLEQLKETYSKKLDNSNKLIEKYKRMAKGAVNRYIESQATKLGIDSKQIKSRLSESYTFSDIDRICEELQEYSLNMSRLPFNASRSNLSESIQVRATNVSKNNVMPANPDDDITDYDLKIAGLV